jgi:hypothetical protein
MGEDVHCIIGVPEGLPQQLRPILRAVQVGDGDHPPQRLGQGNIAEADPARIAQVPEDGQGPAG